MNRYVRVVLVTAVAVGASFAVTAARSAEQEPAVIALPTSVVTSLIQYLNMRPYHEVAPLMNGLQRCLQDQVPDEKGIVAERGNCAEIGLSLRRMHTPSPHAPPTVPPSKSPVAAPVEPPVPSKPAQ